MCWCTPEIRTPWCGKPGCEPPLPQRPLTTQEIQNVNEGRPWHVGASKPTDTMQKLALATRLLTESQAEICEANKALGAAQRESLDLKIRIAQLESEQTLTALNALAAVAAYDATEHAELHAKAAAVIVPQAAGPIGRAAEALLVMLLGSVAEKRSYLRRRGWRELATGWEAPSGKLGGAVIDGALQLQVKADAEAVRGAVRVLDR